MTRSVRSSGLLLVAVLAGCALVRPGPLGVPAQGVTAELLLGNVAARRDALTSLRARARLKAGLAGMWTRQAVLVQRPDEVRLDVLSPFGLALAVGTQRDLLWAYSPSEQARYEGPASPPNLARFLGAPVSVRDLVDILMGLPPARVPIRTPALERSGDARWLVILPIEGGVQRIWFDELTLEPRRAEEERAGILAFTVAFDDYREGFPHALDVAAPVAGASARLAYDDIERNVPLDGMLFAPPSTERVLPLGVVPEG